jgi:hypothetical protein
MHFFDIIEKKVIERLNQVYNDAISEGWTDNTLKWTQQIKEKLCNLGHELGFEVCSHKSSALKADWGEWLEYDRRQKEGFLIDVPLVLECEWGNDDAILSDFEKIMISKAKNKIIVFQKKNIDGINKMFDKFKNLISLFKQSSTTDRYLFAGLNCNPQKFEFETFMPFRH